MFHFRLGLFLWAATAAVRSVTPHTFTLTFYHPVYFDPIRAHTLAVIDNSSELLFCVDCRGEPLEKFQWLCQKGDVSQPCGGAISVWQQATEMLKEPANALPSKSSLLKGLLDLMSHAIPGSRIPLYLQSATEFANFVAGLSETSVSAFHMQAKSKKKSRMVIACTPVEGYSMCITDQPVSFKKFVDKSMDKFVTDKSQQLIQKSFFKLPSILNMQSKMMKPPVMNMQSKMMQPPLMNMQSGMMQSGMMHPPALWAPGIKKANYKLSNSPSAKFIQGMMMKPPMMFQQGWPMTGHEEHGQFDYTSLLAPAPDHFNLDPFATSFSQPMKTLK